MAIRILSWITHARRVLQVDELRYALAIESTASNFDNENLVEQELLVSLCAGLVIIEEQNGYIKLVHYTVQEYFERTREKLFPTARLEIAKACLAYLSYEVRISHSLSRPLFDSLGYFFAYWDDHVRSTPEDTSHDLAICFLSQDEKVNRCVKSRFNVMGHFLFTEFRTTGLAMASAMGLYEVALSLILNGKDVNATITQNSQWSGFRIAGGTALHNAAYNGHEMTVSLLIDFGAAVDATPEPIYGTALQLAARAGRESVVRSLLRRGGSPSARDAVGHTVLYEAVSGDDHSMVQCMIDCGTDIEAETAGKEKPLHLAENDSMALLLVANGVNIDSHDKFGTTRLHAAFASDRGDPQLQNAVVKLIASKGANTETLTISRQTVLHLAVALRMDPFDGRRLLHLLIGQGASMEAMDGDGRTPLHIVIQKDEYSETVTYSPS